MRCDLCGAGTSLQRRGPWIQPRASIRADRGDGRQRHGARQAAESSDAPNLDVNHTRCAAAETKWASATTSAEDVDAHWEAEWADAGSGVSYDVRFCEAHPARQGFAQKAEGPLRVVSGELQ